MNFGIILAARMESQRLPGKAILPLFGIPMIELQIKRLKKTKLASKIVLTTIMTPENNILETIASRNGIETCRTAKRSGNAMREYVEVGKRYNFDYCVRVTGDEPLTDGETVDYVIEEAKKIGDFDLVTTKPNFPHGIDYEIYPRKILEKIDEEMNPSYLEREHVTYYIYQKEKEKNFKICRIKPPNDLTLDDTIFLVDTKQDYENMNNLISKTDDIYVSPMKLIKIYLSRESLPK